MLNSVLILGLNYFSDRDSTWVTDSSLVLNCIEIFIKLPVTALQLANSHCNQLQRGNTTNNTTVAGRRQVWVIWHKHRKNLPKLIIAFRKCNQKRLVLPSIVFCSKANTSVALAVLYFPTHLSLIHFIYQSPSHSFHPPKFTSFILPSTLLPCIHYEKVGTINVKVLDDGPIFSGIARLQEGGSFVWKIGEQEKRKRKYTSLFTKYIQEAFLKATLPLQCDVVL